MTILFALELGSGWGHVGKIQPLISRLCARGHRIFVATPQFDVAEKLLVGCEVTVIATPSLGMRSKRLKTLRTFADVLFNTCFHETAQIRARCLSWEAIFKLVQPDVIVCDHAPGAMLAGRIAGTRVVALGTGFSLPGPVFRFPDWRPELKTPSSILHQTEERVLDLLNNWLQDRGCQRLSQISDLYHQASAQILATRPEVDCYVPRDGNPRYFGVWPAQNGSYPTWPEVHGQRILAYLKPFAGLHLLLSELRGLSASSIVVCPGIHPTLAAACTGSRVQILERPVDLLITADQCDLAIGHGTHGFSTELMLRGKPQLMIPQVLEQRLTAECIQRHGAGLIAYQRHPEDMLQKLRKLCSDNSYALAAVKLQISCQQSPTATLGDAVDAILKR